MSQYPPPHHLGYQSPQPPPIKTYLVESILVMIFCCQPLGIAAIVFAAMASSKLSSHDYAGAADMANKARQFTAWGFFIGLVFWVVWLGFVVLGGILQA